VWNVTTGLGLSAYIDVPRYLRWPTGQETASLVGLNTTLGGALTVGATSIQVVSSTGWAPGLAWILDGPTSEVVTVTGSVDGTHVTIAALGLAFAHNAGVSFSQAGSGGALAEVILDASAHAENYCTQGSEVTDRSLFALTRTERWELPSTRAFLTNDLTMSVRPGHFPMQSVTALSVDLGLGQTVTLDQTVAELASGGRLIELPYLLTNGLTVGQELLLDRYGPYGLSRSGPYWVNVTYVGGVTAGSVPYDIQRAVIFIVSDYLSQRHNPTGASEMDLGKRKLVQRQRGDLVGDSLLLLRAHDLLDNWAQGQF
jgi:hypothetical protein